MKYSDVTNILINTIFALSAIRNDSIKGISLFDDKNKLITMATQGSSYNSGNDNEIDISKTKSIRIWGYLYHNINKSNDVEVAVEDAICKAMYRCLDFIFRHRLGIAIDFSSNNNNFNTPETLFVNPEVIFKAESFRTVYD